VAINANKPERWKEDVAASVDQFNDWFLRFAPATYRETRRGTARVVRTALRDLGDLLQLTPEALREHPGTLHVLRMSTAPPLARDRLTGLSGVNRSLVARLEEGSLPPRMDIARLTEQLGRICRTIVTLLDQDLLPWLGEGRSARASEHRRAAIVIADRLCGFLSDPIIRNAQERRQLERLSEFLEHHGYRAAETGAG